MVAKSAAAAGGPVRPAAVSFARPWRRLLALPAACWLQAPFATSWADTRTPTTTAASAEQAKQDREQDARQDASDTEQAQQDQEQDALQDASDDDLSWGDSGGDLDI